MIDLSVIILVNSTVAWIKDDTSFFLGCHLGFSALHGNGCWRVFIVMAFLHVSFLQHYHKLFFSACGYEHKQLMIELRREGKGPRY